MNELKTLPAPYEEVRDRLITVHAAWKVYGQLFDAEGRVKLLDRLVPSFGWLIQAVLGDSVILGICRLNERGKPVTLPALVKSLKTLANPSERKNLDDQLKSIEKIVAPLKTHRDTRIAHNGRLRVKPLPAITRKPVQKALDAMDFLMGDVNNWFLNQGSLFVPEMTGDGDGLIGWLQYGERLMELQDDSWTGRLTDQQVIEKLRVRMLDRM